MLNQEAIAAVQKSHNSLVVGMERGVRGHRCIKKAECEISNVKVKKCICVCETVNWKLAVENRNVGRFQINEEPSSTN